MSVIISTPTGVVMTKKLKITGKTTKYEKTEPA
jgi:hypothetical protein